MQKILALSSQVACGSVGLSAIVPALQALQQSVIALPTVYLSNHPGHTHVAGQRIDPSVLADMLRAIDNNGWLADVSTVLTGYCPTAEHVRFAREAVNVTQGIVRVGRRTRRMPIIVCGRVCRYLRAVVGKPHCQFAPPAGAYDRCHQRQA